MSATGKYMQIACQFPTPTCRSHLFAGLAGIMRGFRLAKAAPIGGKFSSRKCSLSQVYHGSSRTGAGAQATVPVSDINVLILKSFSRYRPDLAGEAMS